MSGLTHSPAQIVRQLLVDLGEGTMPSAGGSWPVYAERMPDTPDSAILITTTVGRSLGRDQITGEIQEHYGFQVMVRDANPRDGYEKANSIRVTLSETALRNTVSLTPNVGTGTDEYLVYAVGLISAISDLGKEEPNSKRNLFTINASMSVRQTA